MTLYPHPTAPGRYQVRFDEDQAVPNVMQVDGSDELTLEQAEALMDRFDQWMRAESASKSGVCICA